MKAMEKGFWPVLEKVPAERLAQAEQAKVKWRTRLNSLLNDGNYVGLLKDRKIRELAHGRRAQIRQILGEPQLARELRCFTRFGAQRTGDGHVIWRLWYTPIRLAVHRNARWLDKDGR
jgi:hypothetical protein